MSISNTELDSASLEGRSSPKSASKNRLLRGPAGYLIVALVAGAVTLAGVHFATHNDYATNDQIERAYNTTVIPNPNIPDDLFLRQADGEWASYPETCKRPLESDLTSGDVERAGLYCTILGVEDGMPPASGAEGYDD